MKQFDNLFEPMEPIPPGEEMNRVAIGDVLGYDALDDVSPDPLSAGPPRDL